MTKILFDKVCFFSFYNYYYGLYCSCKQKGIMKSFVV